MQVCSPLVAALLTLGAARHRLQARGTIVRPLRCLAAGPFHLRTRRVSRALKGLRPPLQFSDAPGMNCVLFPSPISCLLSCCQASVFSAVSLLRPRLGICIHASVTTAARAPFSASAFLHIFL